MLLLVLSWFPVSTGLWSSHALADTLTPQQRQQIIDDGYKAADQDQRIHEIDKQVNQGNVTPQQRTDLQNEKADLERRINGKKGAANALGGQEGGRLFDRAREARNKQWEKKALEEQLKNATGREKTRIERKINRITTELQNDYRDLGTLKDLPASSSSGSGSSQGTPGANLGTAFSPTNGGLQVGYKIKGTARLGSGKAIVKTKLNLPTLVTGVNMVNENVLNPEAFLAFGGTAGFWGKGDGEVPPVSEVAGNGNWGLSVGGTWMEKYSTKVTAHIDWSKVQSFKEVPDSSLADTNYYRVVIGHGFDVGALSLGYSAFKSYQADGSQPVHVGINDNPAKIFGVNRNPWQIGEEVNQAGLNIDGWTHHAMPWGTTLAWQPTGDATVLDTFSQNFSSAIKYQEENAGIWDEPVHSWNPKHWQNYPAFAVPTIKLKLEK